MKKQRKLMENWLTEVTFRSGGGHPIQSIKTKENIMRRKVVLEKEKESEGESGGNSHTPESSMRGLGWGNYLGLNPLVIGGHVTPAASENDRVRGGTAPDPKLTKTERSVLFNKERDNVKMKISVHVKTGEVTKRQKEATENKEIRIKSEIEAKAGKFGETVKMKKEKERVKQEMKQELVKKLEKRKNVSEKVNLVNENIKKNEVNRRVPSIPNKQTYNLSTRNSDQITVPLKNGGGRRVRTAIVSECSASHTQKNKQNLK